MAYSIKINADASDIKRSLMDVSRAAKDLGKSKISFLDKNERDFLSGQAQKVMEDVRKSIQGSTEEIKRLQSEQSKVLKGSEKELELQRKISKEIRKKANLEREMSRLSQARSQLSVPGFGGKALGGLGKVLGSFPGRAAGSLGGILTGLGAGTLGLGAAGLGVLGGVGGLGLARGIAGSAQYSGGIDSRIGLLGMGVGTGLTQQNRAANAGLSAQAFRERRIRDINAFGRSGATEEDVLRRAEFERSGGIEAGALTNIGAQLRQTMGGQGAQEAVAKLQASILASGIEDALGPYLETATQLLSNINENGTLNSTEILGVLSELSKNGADAPEQIAKSFKSLQDSFRGSSGEANAFFQTALGAAGLGGGTIFGAQNIIKRGLFQNQAENIQGLGAGELRSSRLDLLKRSGMLGGPTFRQTGGAVLNRLLQEVGQKPGTPLDKLSGDQFNTLKSFAAGTLGMGTGSEDTAQILFRLEDAIKANDPEKIAKFQKEMEKAQMSPELKNLDAIKSSSAGQLAAIKDLNKSISEQVGGKLVDVNIAIKTAVQNIDKSLLAVTDFFGMTEEKNNVQQSLKNLSKEELDDFSKINKMLEQENKSPFQRLKESIFNSESEESGSKKPFDFEGSLESSGYFNKIKPMSSLIKPPTSQKESRNQSKSEQKQVLNLQELIGPLKQIVNNTSNIGSKNNRLASKIIVANKTNDKAIN